MSGVELAVLSVAVSAVSAVSQIKAAQEKKKMYDMQANAARIQGKVTALKYKQEGVEKLKKLNRVLAANTARSAAGNIDPYSSGGSPDIINTYSLRQGVNDFTISRDNQTMAVKMANYQAAQYNYAGKVAVKNAQRSAVMTMGQSFVQAGFLYGSGGFTGGQSIFSGSATTAPTGSNIFNPTTTPAGSNILNLNTYTPQPSMIV